MTASVLLGIGATYVTDLSLVINTLSIANTLQVITVVLDAGLGGVLVGFHFIESDVSAGLFMANMGGAGNVAVAVLSATRRMVLMPFARIPFHFDGVLILALVGLVAPLLMR